MTFFLSNFLCGSFCAFGFCVVDFGGRDLQCCLEIVVFVAPGDEVIAVRGDSKGWNSKEL